MANSSIDLEEEIWTPHVVVLANLPTTVDQQNRTVSAYGNKELVAHLGHYAEDLKNSGTATPVYR